MDNFTQFQSTAELDHLGKSLHLNSTFEKILNIDIIKSEKDMPKQTNADLAMCAPTLSEIPTTDPKLKASYQQRLEA